MAFEIKTIDPVLFAEIYTPEVAKELDQFIYPSRNWTKRIGQSRWAIDESKRACLIWVHMADRMNSDTSYALVWSGQTVLISEKDYCCYAIVHASGSLSARMGEAKEMMREALRVGGRFLDGKTDPKSSSAVPQAEFLNQ